MQPRKSHDKEKIFVARLLNLPFFQDKDNTEDLSKEEHDEIHAFADDLLLAYLERLPAFKQWCDKTGVASKKRESALRPGQSREAEVSISRDPQSSIQRNHVICLVCNKSFKLLSNRHLALHGLTPREYKQKYGIRMSQALSARTLSARRRKLAKELGMGKQLRTFRADAREDRGQHDSANERAIIPSPDVSPRDETPT